MSLLGLSLTQLLTVFAAFGGAVTLLYILKLRRRRVHVPFAKLWMRVLQEQESTSLFRRLKRLLSLLLQLAFLALIIGALGDPRLSAEVMVGRNIVVLLDASASMRSTDGEEGTRMETALRRAKEIVRGMGGADSLMLVRMDAQVTPLSGFDSDEKSLLKALEDVKASDTRADVARALKFCADALTGRKNATLVLIGDGAYPAGVLERVLVAENSGKSAPVAPSTRPASQPAEALGGLDQVDLRNVIVRYVPVGKSSDNIGIVAFNARRYSRNKLSFEVFLEVVNYRDKPAEADLQLLIDGGTVEVQRLSLKPGEKARYTCDPEDGKERRRKSWCQLAASGELLEARLSAPGSGNDRSKVLDSFPVDDHAYALLPKPRKLKVLLVTKSNLYLEGALLLDESLEVSKIPPDGYTEKAAAAVDAVVFDGFFPEKAPPRSFLLVNPPDEHCPFPLGKKLAAPLITDQDTKHPVMRWITLKDLNVSLSVTFTPGPGVQALASSFKTPVIVARQEGAIKSVAIGFDVIRSDLPLRVAFPLLIINSLDWFAGDTESLIASYRTGETWSVPLASAEEQKLVAAQVTDPAGTTLTLPVQEGRVLLYGSQVGVYRVKAGDEQARIAANLADPDESRIQPTRELTIGGRRLEAPSGFGLGLRREIWIYLLLAAIGLTLVEWLTYNRRMTV
jgi:Ca-activated chloride channel homolog